MVQSGGRIEARTPARVYLKDTWEGQWERAWEVLTSTDVGKPVQGDLIAERCAFRASPSLDEAVFTWHYGKIIQQNSMKAAWFARQSLVGKFVRVKIRSNMDPFIGVIHAVQDEDMGWSSGDQTFTAYGLAYLLENITIGSAWITNGSSVEEIDHVPVFNERYDRGVLEIGNRSDNKVGPPDSRAYAFSDDNEPWTARDIVEYLLAHYRPRGVKFVLGGQIADLDTIIPPKLNLAGLSVREALNEVIDRRRGFTWSVRVTEADAGMGEASPGEATVTLHVSSIAAAGAEVGTETYPKNAEEKTFSTIGFEVSDVRIGSNATQAYGKIRVLGERVRSMFTLSFSDGTLQAAWLSTEATAYKNGAGGDDAELNDLVRAGDQFRHVFTTFMPPSNWNWKAGDGEGVAINIVNITVEDDGRIDPGTQSPIRRSPWQHVFLDRLLIEKVRGWEEWTPEYLEPFVLLPHPDQEGTYVYCEKLADLEKPGANLRLLDNVMAFEVGFNPNHILAEGSWSGANDSGTEPVFNYADIIATMAVELDERLKVEVTLDGNNTDKVLTIEVAGAHLWWIVPQTVIGINASDGTLEKHEPSGSPTANYPAGNVVRNDIKRLRKIAAIAQGWYSVPRSTVSFTVADLDDQLRVGNMLTRLNTGSELQVNTIVTEVDFDLRNQTTHYATGFLELDLRDR